MVWWPDVPQGGLLLTIHVLLGGSNLALQRLLPKVRVWSGRGLGVVTTPLLLKKNKKRVFGCPIIMSSFLIEAFILGLCFS